MSEWSEIYLEDKKRKQWWLDAARKWLVDPTIDSELLYVASDGIKLTDPTLSRQCLVEARERRKRKR